MKKICYIATISAVVHSFLRPLIMEASKHYSITVICNEEAIEILQDLPIELITFPIKRKPSFWNDLFVLYKLIRLFRHERFAIVHSIMPKTGLLAMLGSSLARIPVRLHTYTGQIWHTRTGIFRWIYKTIDRVIFFLSSFVFVDSPSQRKFLIDEKVISEGKSNVLGYGSICGVNTDRFKPDQRRREFMRNQLNYSQDDVVIIYVGRLTREKGIFDLLEAFNSIQHTFSSIKLLFVGSEEDITMKHVSDRLGVYNQLVTHVSFTKKPEDYFVASDIFCLPSYREGFGLTLIEASSCGLPVVGSKIYGITDAIVDGETGYLFAKQDYNELASALSLLIQNKSLRFKMGKSGRERAQKFFESSYIAKLLVKQYDKFIQSAV